MAKKNTEVKAEPTPKTNIQADNEQPLSNDALQVIVEQQETRIIVLEAELEEKGTRIVELEAELAEKDALIEELQAAIDAKDSSSLEVAQYPEVTHEGVTYEVRTKKLKLRGDATSYTLEALKDPAFVAKLVEMKAGYLVPKK